jgi:membrane protease YdiL (CAAX protease family)
MTDEKIMNPPTRRTIITGVLFILALLLVSSSGLYFVLLRFFGVERSGTVAMVVSRCLFWATLLVAWFYTVKEEHLPMLTWGNKKNNFTTYLLSVIAMFFSITILNGVCVHIVNAIIHHKEQSERLIKMIEIFRNNIPLLVFSAVTAGVTEELLFRGYLLPRFALLFKNDYVAVFISSLLFALMHAGYGTITNMVGPLIIGTVFAIHYLKYRNMVFLVIFHTVWDLIALFILLRTQH